uniref:BTB domain-containing protein n=1 Tax=Chrysotila carterae TaxID=13221 RepID=A0A7S4BM30_CHRCT|mmetsp:Transcript_53000/g.115649  ORF Transcript_53000/g.115649 Transcript_53000/m.115649 type:complete len:534 (-) Transcript_53000:931-2532(-)
MAENSPQLTWTSIPKGISTSLPFAVKLSAVGSDGEPVTNYDRSVTFQALSRTVCLEEGFENKDLGLWQPACLPGHYEHGFDSELAAPGSEHSLFLKGGNDANFGMTLKLPSQGGGHAESVATQMSSDSEAEAAPSPFRPDAVSFYVRTNSASADAGHFILGESNEVNKRVAQFQFTKEGRMGLLGTGGITHGATPYVPNVWYLIELRFDWTRKSVAFYVDRRLQQRHIPFRRDTSSFIGACALGNRDRCTTWFDSIEFVKETQLFTTTVGAGSYAPGGTLEVWLGPLRDNAAKEGFVLRAEDSLGAVSPLSHTLYPMCKIENAQRVAINNAALADFTTLLQDEASCDVAFLVGGGQLHAHRVVLSARCEAFRRMFNSPMREGSKDFQQIEMLEASFAAFEVVLKFIYGGAVDVPAELAVEILGLADRFLLDGLKLLCGFTLARMLTTESVVRVLQAADRWDAPGSRLKSLCMDFILSNYSEVVATPVFEELTSSPHLLVEITRSAARVISNTGEGLDSPEEAGLSQPKRSRRV